MGKMIECAEKGCKTVTKASATSIKVGWKCFRHATGKDL